MPRFNIMLAATFLLLANSAKAEPRWYSENMVIKGSALFSKHCAICHGKNAEGTEDWRTADTNGKYPPPPLNGTAHTWHHDIPVLKRVIREGGIRLGGSMPPFKGILKDQEINQLIAYFQSKWPDQLYTKWALHFKPEKVNN